jgi:hypothetical protein
LRRHDPIGRRKRLRRRLLGLVERSQQRSVDLVIFVRQRRRNVLSVEPILCRPAAWRLRRADCALHRRLDVRPFDPAL